jgi:hypothetical protein
VYFDSRALWRRVQDQSSGVDADIDHDRATRLDGRHSVGVAGRVNMSLNVFARVGLIEIRVFGEVVVHGSLSVRDDR